MQSPKLNTQSKLLNLTSQATIFTSLLGLSFLIPAVVHQQVVTGPLVNAILLLASQLLSPGLAILIGMLPSTVALSRGLLPLSLAAMVPFIILANSLFVLVFSQVLGTSFVQAQAKSSVSRKTYSYRFVLAVLMASLAKFGLLFSASHLVLNQLLSNKFVLKASQMMGWAQLATALAGGVIAWIVIKTIYFSKNA